MIKPNLSEKSNPLPSSSDTPHTIGDSGPNFGVREITCVSELAPSEDRFPFHRGGFVYRVHLANLTTAVSFVFNDLERAKQRRNKLILGIIDFWGSESVLFANGFGSCMVVVSSICGISKIQQDGCVYTFDIEVTKVDNPITVVQADLETAIALREQLNMHLNSALADGSRTRGCKNVRVG